MPEQAIESGSHTYTPNGGAKLLFETHDPEVLICGAAGTGKSAAAIRKCDALAELNPGIRVLWVRQTRKALTESVLVEFERWQPAGSAILSGADRAHRSRYTYPNGSEIVLAGLDEPQRIMSSQFDVAYVNEATEVAEASWELLTSRLRNGALRDRRTGRPWHQAIADCNPSFPSHWLKRRCDAGRMTYIESKHEDNPACTREYIDRLAQLTGVRRQRLYEGRWVAAEGAVYSDFDRAVHLIDRFDIPSAWQRIRCVDFGFRDPFVCLWLAADPAGVVYVYRQLYRTERLVEDHAADILELSAGEHIETGVCDHDREDRGTLERRGIPTVAAQKDIATGIQAVQARLRRGADGRPRLYVFRDSLVSADPKLLAHKKPTCIEDEFEAYQWQEIADGRALKEVPCDRDNHALDALRYGVRWIDGGAVGLGCSVVSRSEVCRPTDEDLEERFWTGSRSCVAYRLAE